MNNENICLSSQTVNIAETKNYLELTNRVCFYDEPNLNGVRLLSEDALIKAETLVNQPVVAKYKQNAQGLPTFGSHQVSIDKEGNVIFGTDNIGTHTDVYIENDDVNVNGTIKNLPCLFAKYRIWTRNLNVVAAVKRLFSEGKLYSSWEISSLAYTFENGIKTLTDYFFESNCLLGFETSSPAYGIDAKGISLSSKDSQLMIAEAFSQDLLSDIDTQKSIKEDKTTLTKQKEIVISDEIEEIVTEVVAETEVTQETSIEAEVIENAEEETPVTETEELISEEIVVVETSALTERDLRERIREACRNKIDKWCYVAYHFPIEREILMEVDERKSELDYVLFTYTVENDVVTVSEPTEVTLTVSVKELNTTIASLNSDIETKNGALAEASKTIQTLHVKIAELVPFKESFDQAEKEKIEAETVAKKEDLKATLIATGQITKDDIETSEVIKGLIESLNEKELNQIIATRLIASLKQTATKSPKVETASIKEVVATASLVNDESELDYKPIMKSFLGGKK